jgi:hypothetical protein
MSGPGVSDVPKASRTDDYAKKSLHLLGNYQVLKLDIRKQILSYQGIVNCFRSLCATSHLGPTHPSERDSVI